MSPLYRIPPDGDGKRLQDYLMKAQGYSVRLIRRLKQQPGAVLQNGVPLRMIDRISAGDEIAVTLPADPEAEADAARRVPIVYEDGELLVYNKPPFLAVHPCREHQRDTLAQVFLRDMEERGISARFRPIYRLDRDTDGLIAIAKDPLTAARLAGKLPKEYTAVVRGRLEPPAGTVDAPIGQLEPHRMKRGILPKGQRAVTHYETLACSGQYSLLRLRLETGRTHQIRVHMASLGHPLAGDALYGGEDASGLRRQALTCTRLLLPPGAERPEPCEICINMQSELLNLV